MSNINQINIMSTITKDQLKQLRELACTLNSEIERENNHPVRSIVVDCYFDDEDEPTVALYVTSWPTRCADDESRVQWALKEIGDRVKAVGLDCLIESNTSENNHTAIWTIEI